MTPHFYCSYLGVQPPVYYTPYNLAHEYWQLHPQYFIKPFLYVDLLFFNKMQENNILHNYKTIILSITHPIRSFEGII